MITKDCIESAYCFFHQKWRVYEYSHDERQKEDIEFAISSYVEGMNNELYTLLSEGRTDFLVSSTNFQYDMPLAISRLNSMIENINE